MFLNDNELLDYCRVKKIFDKGFGFLSSLYFTEPVFFHFNKVKDPDIKEKLEKLKRGEVYFFYTSIMHNGKRKVLKLWLDVKDIEITLIPDFIKRIIEEINIGQTNIFELAYVIKQLRKNNFISDKMFEEILNSKKILKTPSAIKSILNDNELSLNNNLDDLIDKLESKKITETEWVDLMMEYLSA